MEQTRPIKVAQIRKDRSLANMIKRNRPAVAVLLGSFVLAVFLGIQAGRRN